MLAYALWISDIPKNTIPDKVFTSWDELRIFPRAKLTEKRPTQSNILIITYSHSLSKPPYKNINFF